MGYDRLPVDALAHRADGGTQKRNPIRKEYDEHQKDDGRDIALANAGVPLTVTVQLLSPAAPVPTPHPDTGGVTTPEPSSEPVIGDVEPTEKPTHSGEAGGATPTPVPTDSNPRITAQLTQVRIPRIL